ncbi:MAG: amino acid ABC transporter permease [Propionibacteriaceae bacterium]|nr:amino acid ABC transporter permease [Propionibacteriaceae bacterium]
MSLNMSWEEIVGALLLGWRMTLTLAGIAMVLAFLGGTVIAILRVSPIPIFRAIGTTYVELVRNTPLTVLFFFAVFLSPHLGIKATFFQAAVFALTAYNFCQFSEAVRSGLNAVPKGQSEASRALGMTTMQMLLSVIIPQAIRAMIPPLASGIVIVVKGSSVAGVFGVVELINSMNNLSGLYGEKVIQILVVVVLLFLAVNLPIGFFSNFMERRLKMVR